MLIKSSMESEELAYDTANIVYKRVGPTYDKWWMKEGYGQNYAWVVAEHSDYSVRLFFEFMDTGFCYVKVHFTNGASYEDLIADSWNYAKESPEYPFEETCDHVRNFLDNFFEAGGGMDKLRAKYEKGNNSYDVDSYIEKDGYVKNSRKPVKSAVDNISKVRVNLDGNDTLLDLFESVGVYDSTRYDYSVESFAEACKNVLGKGKTHSYISNKDTVIIETKYGFIELIPMEHDFESASDVKLYFDTFMSNGVKSSRKPIKSANYNGFNLEARRSYGKGNGYFTTYPVWDTDLDTSIGAIEYHYAVENPYYVAWVYDDFGANKTGRTKAFDTEEECLEWIGEELASGTTARDKLLKYWEELGYDYKSKNLNNSRKPVKSSAQSDYDKGADYAEEQYQKYVEGGIDAEDIAAPADCSDDFFNGFNDKILEYKISSSRKPVKSSVAPDGLSFDNRIDNDDSSIVQYKVTDENVLDKVKGYLSYGEDELKPGNVFINLMYDDSDTLVAAQVVDTESSTWDLSPEECIEIFGSDIMTDANPKVGKHAVDEFMDFDVDPETVKSSFVVGKQNNGNKVYFCEDGQYYSENDYSRPSIKTFNNKSEADKIAKRSKSGFVSPLEK